MPVAYLVVAMSRSEWSSAFRSRLALRLGIFRARLPTNRVPPYRNQAPSVLAKETVFPRADFPQTHRVAAPRGPARGCRGLGGVFMVIRLGSSVRSVIANRWRGRVVAVRCRDSCDLLCAVARARAPPTRAVSTLLFVLKEPRPPLDSFISCVCCESGCSLCVSPCVASCKLKGAAATASKGGLPPERDLELDVLPVPDARCLTSLPERVSFDSGKSAILPVSSVTIEAISQVMLEVPGMKVAIVGYADEQERDVVQLSRARATAVVDRLVAREVASVPPFRGLATRFVIDLDGTVSDVSAQSSTLPDPQTVRCVMDVCPILLPPP